MNCQTIDEVIDALNLIIEDAKLQQNPLGYFAVLYRKVTYRVKKGIVQGEFENAQRMEKLDVIFANRYFEAYQQYKANIPCSESWRVAFEAANEKGHIILQHLLLGINAHINLDLGIAALDTAGQDNIDSIHKDFDAINSILSELVDDVKRNISNVSPIFKWLIPLAKKSDEMMINFSIQIARDGAWSFAKQLSVQNKNAEIIKTRDKDITFLANNLRKPGRLLQWINRIIGFAEWRKVSENLAILERD